MAEENTTVSDESSNDDFDSICSVCNYEGEWIDFAWMNNDPSTLRIQEVYYCHVCEVEFVGKWR